MVFATQLEADSYILLIHLRRMASRLRELPEDKWDWTFALAAPTPRTLATHALSWLQCDRQHIHNPDAKTHHLLPEPPTDAGALCDALEAEADEWERLLSGLSEEQLVRKSLQFGQEDGEMNVRGYVAHMVQNVIYKHGQFSEVYFALGLDGEEPYTAPFPNAIYRELLGLNKRR
jgi:uncharacterized damage-inducible protein DinB